ncbi:MAG TPA: AraC family transcriptional regulator [Clostridiales bacterium]|nr:AraC family transcriptional regulator [Clostridiales bacterium]
MNYYEEQRPTINGIPSNTYCHLQEKECQGLVVEAHYHNYIELLYGLSGNFDVHLNDGIYNFGPGDLLLINSQEVHQIEASSENGGQYYVVRFEPDVIYTLSQNVFEMKYILPFTLNNYSHQKVFKHEVIDNTLIPALLDEIMKEFDHKQYGYELAIKAHICKVFLWILRYWDKSGVKLNSIYDMDDSLLLKLQDVFYYVENHYDKDIKVTEMAKICGMSYSYFSRTFNKAMNTSFNEYLNYVRISEAEKLLLTADLNVTEIAMKVGFSTASYFIMQFKSYKNMPPNKYKKIFLQTLT